MLFNSFTFAIFFLLFFPVYWLTARWMRLQTLLILAAGYLFYGWWDERFLILLIAATITDYIGGTGVSGRLVPWSMVWKALGFGWAASFISLAPVLSETLWIFGWLAGFSALVVAGVLISRKLAEEARRKLFLAGAITLNLGMLGFFKYFNFFSHELASAFSTVGVTLDPVVLHVILPVGISFYTFQSMSFTLDIYRRNFEPTDRLLEFAAYVSFFPQLVAGPIERAKNLLPQFFKRRQFSWDNVRTGLWLFAWGLYKKLVIADNVAPIANAVFTAPSAHSSLDLLAGLIAFTFQIYCDFSGYSDMARGLARSLGFEISVNFRLPYLSRTPQEFWRGWHISLSTWLRDYLYVPLGGNRGSEWLTYRNLALTMLIGGLWHGARWNFVAWGAYQGFILIVYRLAGVDEWIARRSRSNTLSPVTNVLLWAVMFCLVVYGWLLFRADNMQLVWDYTAGLARLSAGGTIDWGTLLAYVLPLMAVQLVQKFTGTLELLPRLSGLTSLTVKTAIICGLIFLSAATGQRFIYFDF